MFLHWKRTLNFYAFKLFLGVINGEILWDGGDGMSPYIDYGGGSICQYSLNYLLKMSLLTACNLLISWFYRFLCSNVFQKYNILYPPLTNSQLIN